MELDLRCAVRARADGVSPIGTAGHEAGYLCLEFRRPWPKDLGEVDLLAPLARSARDRGVRLQGVLPQAGGGASRAFLYHHDAAGDGFGGYLYSEVLSGPGALVGHALALLEAGTSDPEPPRSARDVLICTHGRRDVCCGSRGSALLAELDRSGGLGPGVRLWGSTHLGGHRFAPTVLILPEGTLWAYMEPDLLRSIVKRDGAVTDVLPYYRGCAGLVSSAAQAVERAVFELVGWDLLDSRRFFAECGDGRVRLDVIAPDGAIHSWAAEVAAREVHPVPACGRSDAEAMKSEVEPVVERIWPVHPGSSGACIAEHSTRQ